MSQVVTNVNEMQKELTLNRKNHFDSIENMTYKELKDLVSIYLIFCFQKKKSYVPRKKTMEELMREVRYRHSWKGSGN